MTQALIPIDAAPRGAPPSTIRTAPSRRSPEAEPKRAESAEERQQPPFKVTLREARKATPSKEPAQESPAQSPRESAKPAQAEEPAKIESGPEIGEEPTPETIEAEATSDQPVGGTNVKAEQVRVSPTSVTAQVLPVVETLAADSPTRQQAESAVVRDQRLSATSPNVPTGEASLPAAPSSEVVATQPQSAQAVIHHNADVDGSSPQAQPVAAPAAEQSRDLAAHPITSTPQVRAFPPTRRATAEVPASTPAEPTDTTPEAVAPRERPLVPEPTPKTTPEPAPPQTIPAPARAETQTTLPSAPAADAPLPAPAAPAAQRPPEPSLAIGPKPAAPQASESAEAAPAPRLVARGLSAAMAQRGGVIHVKLIPASLGEVRIKMDLEPGAVSVRIDASTPAAQQLLSEHLGVLRHTLESRGLQVDRLSVNYTPTSNVPAAPTTTASSHSGQSGQFDQYGTQQERHDSAGSQSRGRSDERPAEHSPENSRAERGDTAGQPDFARRFRLNLAPVA